MTDDRDICERLEDQSIDGAIYLRLNAAKEIRALRHYVARLEDELAEEEYQHGRTIIKLENAQEHSSDQALDIVTLGQEVGRLREALEPLAKVFLYPDDLPYEHAEDIKSDSDWCEDANDMQTQDVFILRRDIRTARAALAEKEEK